MNYSDLHDAYYSQLKQVMKEYDYVNSPRGYKSYEKLAVNFTIDNPKERLCFLPSRKSNLAFHFAEVLWYLAGVNDVEFIAYYAPSIRQYSIDSHTLTGTAYGPKLFGYGEKKVNQWERVVRILKDDPDSKRAVIQLFDPSEDLGLINSDVTCTMGVQFLKRDNKLDLIAFMRANDVYRGFLSDIFSFTFMQELMAKAIGVELGSYHHIVGSLHLYEKDKEKALRVLEESDNKCCEKAPFPEMPSGNYWDHINCVLDYEKRIREGKKVFTNNAIKAIAIPKYWQDIIRVFAVYSGLQRHNRLESTCFNELPPAFQKQIKNKWGLL